MKVKVIRNTDDNWYKVGEMYDVHEETKHLDGYDYHPLVSDRGIGIGVGDFEVVKSNFPLEVKCIDNKWWENVLEEGKIYTATGDNRCTDYFLEGHINSYKKSRFEIVPNETVVEEVDHISEAQKALKEWKGLTAQTYVPDPEEEKRGGSDKGTIDAHYSFNYTLTDKDREAGTIKVDPYFVAKQWRLGSKDDTGVLFHCLKNISRYSDKNSREREITALYLQVKRLAELEGVKLD